MGERNKRRRRARNCSFYGLSKGHAPLVPPAQRVRPWPALCHLLEVEGGSGTVARPAQAGALQSRQLELGGQVAGFPRREIAPPRRLYVRVYAVERGKEGRSAVLRKPYRPSFGAVRPTPRDATKMRLETAGSSWVREPAGRGGKGGSAHFGVAAYAQSPRVERAKVVHAVRVAARRRACEVGVRQAVVRRI
jgi:hypothetical protein